MKRTLPLLITLAVYGPLGLPQTSLAAAYYFESTTTTEGEGMGRNGQTMGVRAWIDGESAKVEFTEGGDQAGFFSEGSYLLTMDGGEALYLVNPAEMTYSELNLDELFGMVGNIMNATGGLVEMEFSDLTNEKVAEEPGGEILGYSTTRYEFHTGYTMSIGVLGFNRSQRSDSQQELWCTDELDAEGFNVWLRPDRFRTGNEELDGFMKAQFQQIDCLPLRTRSTTTSGEGRGSSTVSTTEVTVLREESSIDPATFELPSGYEAVSLIPELPEGFSFPQGAGSEGQGDEDDAQDRPRLRDLFRR